MPYSPLWRQNLLFLCSPQKLFQRLLISSIFSYCHTMPESAYPHTSGSHKNLERNSFCLRRIPANRVFQTLYFSISCHYKRLFNNGSKCLTALSAITVVNFPCYMSRNRPDPSCIRDVHGFPSKSLLLPAYPKTVDKPVHGCPLSLILEKLPLLHLAFSDTHDDPRLRK